MENLRKSCSFKLSLLFDHLKSVFSQFLECMNHITVKQVYYKKIPGSERYFLKHVCCLCFPKLQDSESIQNKGSLLYHCFNDRIKIGKNPKCPSIGEYNTMWNNQSSGNTMKELKQLN